MGGMEPMAEAMGLAQGRFAGCDLLAPSYRRTVAGLLPGYR